MDHIGLVHLSDGLSGVGGQGFHVATLPLGVDRIEGKRRFARAGDAGDDDQPVPGNIEIDVLEVVLRSALDANRVH
jgi:hypothetical protein